MVFGHAIFATGLHKISHLPWYRFSKNREEEEEEENEQH